MFFASKIACSGIVLLLMTPWTSGPRPMPLNSGTNLSSEVLGETHWNDVNEMQQILQDKGHYRGKIDGVFGLRTRASIRGFQKAENLPATGQLDKETARKLGVAPEEGKNLYQNPGGKPSAGITWAKGSRRTNTTLRNPRKSVAAPGRELDDGGKTLQAEK